MLRTYLSHFHVPAAAAGLLGLALCHATCGDTAHAIGSFVAALGLLGLHLNIRGLPALDGEGEPDVPGIGESSAAGPARLDRVEILLDRMLRAMRAAKGPK